MSEYISRVAAINKIMENIVHQDSHDVNLHNIGLRKAMSAIDSLPAADVVEVVRCWECRKGKWDPWSGAIWCEGKNRKPNFYCADGERKSGGQDDV